MNAETRVWVRAPCRRAPLTFHGAVVRFVHGRLSQTRSLAASNYRSANFFSGRFGPTSAHGVFFDSCFSSLALVCCISVVMCEPRPRSVDDSGLGRIVRHGAAAPDAMQTYPNLGCTHHRRRYGRSEGSNSPVKSSCTTPKPPPASDLSMASGGSVGRAPPRGG